MLEILTDYARKFLTNYTIKVIMLDLRQKESDYARRVIMQIYARSSIVHARIISLISLAKI